MDYIPELGICEKTYRDRGRYFYIDRHGNIFPSCRTYIDKPITSLKDSEAFQKVQAFIWKLEKMRSGGFGSIEDYSFDLITVELSGSCHASCIYCFQRDGVSQNYRYYSELLRFLSKAKTKELFFSGGEILDQPASMTAIRRYCSENNTLPWMHLKTNGNADEEKIGFVEECFDSVMVSFNGFGNQTTSLIMNVGNVDKTIRFCEGIADRGKCNLCVKYLISPISIAGIGDFIRWAATVNPFSIVLQVAFEYDFSADGTTERRDPLLAGLNDSYWKELFARAAKQIESSLEASFMSRRLDSSQLFADREFLDYFPLSPRYSRLFDTSGIYRLR